MMSDNELEEEEETVSVKLTPYGSKCEMANCKSNSDLNIKKSYFRFPQNNYYCSQWTFACGRPDLVDLYLQRGSMFLYKTRKVCEDHFIKEDFRNPALLSQGLFKGVVPTRNLPELKTIINICSRPNSLIGRNEDLIENISVNVSTESNRSLRKYKYQRYCCSCYNYQIIDFNDKKNKRKFRMKNKTRKYRRPRKNKY